MLESNKDVVIQRYVEALKALSRDVETSRRAAEALKIAQSENDDEIAQWNAQIETEVTKADDDVKRPENWLWKR